MNLNTVWRCAQYRRVQWGVTAGIWLSAGVVFWCFICNRQRGNGNAVPAVAAADSTVRTGGAGNGGSAAPDIPPLFTLLPENALPLLTGWQQEPPEQPERWVLTFEAHYPELAALLDTLSGELTQLPITRFRCTR